jgi:hypothetical protein
MSQSTSAVTTRWRYHPQRDVLIAEAHARPFTPLVGPALITRIATLSGQAGEDADRVHMAALCRRLGQPEPGPNARWCVLDAGLWRVRWERHTELSTWTFFRAPSGTTPFAESALDLAPDLSIANPGPVGARQPEGAARGEIDLGLELIAALSPFDVGQCVVVSDGRPVAIEGAEGTDAMLARVAEMRRNGRLKRETGGGVLVKAPKRGQNMRIDIPTIGPETVRRAAEAGLQGIAITVGEVIVADRQETIALADARGLFIEATR